MSKLIEVSPNYYMTLVDSYRSLFAIRIEEGWKVVSVHLKPEYATESEHGIFDTKQQAFKEIERTVREWKGNEWTVLH